MSLLCLKNGTRVHLLPFAGTEACSLLVLFGVGSREESDHVWGGSHFIEHLMFKGTVRRPKTVDISRELDRFGANIVVTPKSRMLDLAYGGIPLGGVTVDVLVTIVLELSIR